MVPLVVVDGLLTTEICLLDVTIGTLSVETGFVVFGVVVVPDKDRPVSKPAKPDEPAENADVKFPKLVEPGT